MTGVVADVRLWRGRGGALGYRLIFRDRGKFYLEYSVSNAAALAGELETAAKLNRRPTYPDVLPDQAQWVDGSGVLRA